MGPFGIILAIVAGFTIKKSVIDPIIDGIYEIRRKEEEKHRKLRDEIAKARYKEK